MSAKVCANLSRIIHPTFSFSLSFTRDSTLAVYRILNTLLRKISIARIVVYVNNNTLFDIIARGIAHTIFSSFQHSHAELNVRRITKHAHSITRHFHTHPITDRFHYVRFQISFPLSFFRFTYTREYAYEHTHKCSSRALG